MEENRIKTFRKSLGFTQKEFAAELGMTRECISNYEIGRREPDGNFYLKLYERFKVKEKAIGEMLLEISRQRNAYKSN